MYTGTHTQIYIYIDYYYIYIYIYILLGDNLIMILCYHHPGTCFTRQLPAASG